MMYQIFVKEKGFGIGRWLPKYEPVFDITTDQFRQLWNAVQKGHGADCEIKKVILETVEKGNELKRVKL